MWKRAAVAAAAVSWLSLRRWHQTSDDLLITLDFARSWAETGSPTWAGHLVEGWSNPTWLALLALAEVAGAPGVLVAKLASVAAAAGLAVVLARTLPERSGLLLAALVLWAPLSMHGGLGMETTLFALALTGGWVLALEGSPWALGLGLLAALTRPEGTGHLVGMAVALRPWERRASVRGALAGVLAGLAGYHAVRVGVLGELWPTPALVKAFGRGPGLGGVRQVAQELVSAGAVLTVLGVGWRLPRRLGWVLAPVGLQVGLLVAVGGDSMGTGRLLLPGLVASAALWARHGDARVLSGWVRSGLWGAVALAVLVEPRTLSRGLWPADLQPVLHPEATLRGGFATPLRGDVAVLVQWAPAGARVLTTDVGMVGAIHDLEVQDAVGLVDREAAVWSAAGVPLWERVARRLADPERAPDAVRVASYADVALPELDGEWRVVGTSANWARTRWYLRGETPSDELVLERWRVLVRRHPGQPWLRAQLAGELRRQGRQEEAVQVLAAAPWWGRGGGRRW